MDTPAPHDDARRSWQDEADLLADGRELLERLCGSARWRYLYPEGPNVALLFEAYQDFDRLRTVGRIRGGRWRQTRRFKKLLRKLVRRDVLARTRRLSYRYPSPRLHRLPQPPEIVRRALSAVDPDVQGGVEAFVVGSGAAAGALALEGAPEGPAGRGLQQFRDALVNEALSRPAAIGSLHPQYLTLLTAPMPKKRHHPIASFVLVKLPLQLALAIITLFNKARCLETHVANSCCKLVLERESHVP